MTRSITARTSLDTLKKEAKRWLRALRGGDAEARRRFEAAYPGGPAAPGLRDVQQALAREHGVASWLALRAELDDQMLAARTHAERVADFLEMASLHYGVRPGTRAYGDYSDSPDRRRQAARILERHPEVGRASLHTAVVCGDRHEVARILAARPGAAREKGGREGWEPLLYLCYGRLPTAAAADDALEIARALLDHGADPDSAWTYDWDDRPMSFSALCGVIGDGESGPEACPPHPRADELATLLLDRGADVNQGQALYNTMLRRDDDHWLRVLIARGLGPGHPIAWEPPSRREGTSIFQYLLDHAVEMNHLRRATTLLEHGARPVASDGKDLYRRALLGGGVEMAELLARHGAARSELSGADAFRAACMRMDRAAAERMVAAHPEYMDQARLLLVDEAAKRDLPDVAGFLLDLGVSPDADFPGPGGRYHALHQAACMNATRIAALLIERGAEVDIRDQGEAATPLAWAVHTHMSGTIELFSRHTRDPFTLAAAGQLDRLRALLAEEPALANATTERALGLGVLGASPGETPLFVVPDDEDRAIEVAELLLAHGADPARRNAEGATPADRARARGLDDLAALLAGATD